MSDPRSFGDWLKRTREAQGYSKVALSKAAEIDRAHIRRMEIGEIGMPEAATRERLHRVFGTTDDQLEEIGVLVRNEYPRPDGSVVVEFTAGKPSPASDIGEHAAIAELLARLPDDAVQHFRKFLEAVVDAR